MFKPLSSVLADLSLNKYSKTKRNDSFTRGIGKKRSVNHFDFLALIKRWPRIVGERLANHTIPLKNKNNVLTILTDHSAYSQQLSFLEEHIKKMIFAEFFSLRSSITRVVFQVNSSFFTQKKIQTAAVISEQKDEVFNLHPYSPEFRRLKAIALEEFQDIKDQELRQVLVSLFIQQHGSQPKGEKKILEEGSGHRIARAGRAEEIGSP